jgi:hypothetical protein
MGRIADAARAGTIAQLSIDEAGNAGADIRFGHETDAETEANQAFQGVAANVMAFNSGAVFGRHEFGPQKIFKLTSMVTLSEQNGFVREVGPIDGFPVGQ